MRRARSALLVLMATLVCLVAAACGSGGDRLETAGPASGSPSLAPSGAMPSSVLPSGAVPSGAVPTGPATRAPQPPSAPASPKVSPPAASPPAGGLPPGAPATVRGRVAEGVEEGCLVLSTGTSVYTLIGGNRALMRPGERVVVVGVPEPGLMTTCQQGTPLRVTSVRPE